MANEQPSATPQSGYQRLRLSLARCRSCGRTEELSPADITARMREGGTVCCGRVMDLFVPASWPAPSGVTAAPRPRVPAG